MLVTLVSEHILYRVHSVLIRYSLLLLHYQLLTAKVDHHKNSSSYKLLTLLMLTSEIHEPSKGRKEEYSVLPAIRQLIV